MLLEDLCAYLRHKGRFFRVKELEDGSLILNLPERVSLGELKMGEPLDPEEVNFRIIRGATL